MESTAVLNRWTEHYSGPYSHELHPETSLFKWQAENLHMLRKAVAEVVNCLKAGMSPGDLKGMAKGVETIAHHAFTKERQSQELPYHQPNKPSQEDHAWSLSSTDSRSRLKNCFQKNNQVLDQTRAQKNRSSTVKSLQRHTYNISAFCSTML